MRLGINDEGMARIATQLRIGQDIQIEQSDSQDTEGQEEITVSRVAFDSGMSPEEEMASAQKGGEEGGTWVVYFSNEAIMVFLPSGFSKAFIGGDPATTWTEDYWDRAWAALNETNSTVGLYSMAESMNASDEEWVAKAQAEEGPAAKEYYGAPGVKM
jgi:hypothetical protein